MKKTAHKFIALLAVSSLLSACSYMPSWMGGRADEKPKLEGERAVALPADGQLRSDDSLLNSPPVLPPVNQNADFAQGYGLFTAATGNLAGGDFTNKQSAKIGDGVKFSHALAPRPVVAGGVVFAMDAAGNISAHDSADISKIRWRSSAVVSNKGDAAIGGGLAVDNGVLYATTGEGAVAALDTATGNQLWRKDFTAPMRAAPRVNGDKLIIVTMDSQAYALSAKTGEILWDHRGINETAGIMNIVSPTIAGESVLVPYASGELFALAMDSGRELWSETLLKNKNTEAYGVFAGIGGDPVVDGEVAFATSNNGITAAISTVGGQRIWQQQIGSLNSPWLAGDDLFVLSTDNTLINMVKYSGKIRWLTKLATYENPDLKLLPISWLGPILVNGKLLVVGSHGEMVLVSALSGKITDTISLPSSIATSPIVAGGKLYLVDKSANLYSFSGNAP